MNRIPRLLTAVITAVSLCLSLVPTAFAAEKLDDHELLARLVWLEARGESDEGQQAVVYVVCNRLNDGGWGDSIGDVIFAPSQFSPARSIPHTTPTEKEHANVRVVLDAIANGTSALPPWVMYFCANGDHNWHGYRHYTIIGGHYFGGFANDKAQYESAIIAESEATQVSDLILLTAPILSN